MTTETATVERYRRPRGQHPNPRREPGKESTRALPEYLEHHEADALISEAPTPRVSLLFLIKWRAGLRVSEALALEVHDLLLEG